MLPPALRSPFFKANGKTDGLASNAFGAERNLRLIGINIDEYGQAILEGFLHLDEVCKRLWSAKNSIHIKSLGLCNIVTPTLG
jgi:hypothetical protein